MKKYDLISCTKIQFNVKKKPLQDPQHLSYVNKPQPTEFILTNPACSISTSVVSASSFFHVTYLILWSLVYLGY